MAGHSWTVIQGLNNPAALGPTTGTSYYQGGGKGSPLCTPSQREAGFLGGEAEVFVGGDPTDGSCEPWGGLRQPAAFSTTPTAPPHGLEGT